MALRRLGATAGWPDQDALQEDGAGETNGFTNGSKSNELE